MSDSVRRHAIDSIAQRVVKTSAAPDANEAPVERTRRLSITTGKTSLTPPLFVNSSRAAPLRNFWPRSKTANGLIRT